MCYSFDVLDLLYFHFHIVEFYNSILVGNYKYLELKLEMSY